MMEWGLGSGSGTRHTKANVYFINLDVEWMGGVWERMATKFNRLPNALAVNVQVIHAGGGNGNRAQGEQM